MNRSSHILIIDDEANLRQTMARILQREGYEVTTAADGKEGLELLARHSVDLVYLDIRMPHINGLDVLKTIHTYQPQLPVILFTAQPDLHTAIQALHYGASDYLLKPLKPSQILEHTKAILAKQEIERRVKEIRSEIQALESELGRLEIGEEPKPEKTGQEQDSRDRYLKRGKITLDLHRYQALVNGKFVNLPLTSFNYLLVLARHAPGVVDYQTLVAEAQGYQAGVREAQELTKWHIHQIRQSIEKNTRRPEYIINVRGTGYRLVSD